MIEGRSRLLRQRAIAGQEVRCDQLRASSGPARSVTVNPAESPLGWLFSRGLVTPRQFDAGERLNGLGESPARPASYDFLDPAPVARGRGGSAPSVDVSGSQLDAKRRFEHALGAPAQDSADILRRVVCSGEGMREAESALGWPAQAGKLVLALALDRVADYYRIR